MRAYVVGESEDEARPMRDALVAAGCEVVAALEPAPDVVVMSATGYQRLQDALAASTRKLAERKLVERAKGLLMRSRNLDEQQAFTLMRRFAMDRKLRLAEVARQLIDAAGLLEAE